MSHAAIWTQKGDVQVFLNPGKSYITVQLKEGRKPRQGYWIAKSAKDKLQGLVDVLS